MTNASTQSVPLPRVSTPATPKPPKTPTPPTPKRKGGRRGKQ